MPQSGMPDHDEIIVAVCAASADHAVGRGEGGGGPETDREAPATGAPYQEDLLLAERILSGSAAAFLEMYRGSSPRLLRRLHGMIGDWEKSEDCLQQVYVEALQHMARYRGEGPLQAWLNRIATNVALQCFRREKRWRGVLGDLVSDRLTAKGPPERPLPERLLAREEIHALVHETLQKLSPKKRIVVLLCDLEGRKLEDVAFELGVPKGTVASRLHHGRRELRKAVARQLKRQNSSVEELFHA